MTDSPLARSISTPDFCVPALACDAHLHIMSAAPAGAPASAAGASVEDYRRIQKILGIQRAVIVTPRIHGTDNRVTTGAIRALGIDCTRGVAVVTPEVTDQELAALHAAGVRGIRFTLYVPDNAPTSFAMVEPLAARVHELGWHVQLHWTAAQIIEHAGLLSRLAAPVVFDHMARLGADGEHHPAFRIAAAMVQTGKAWVKLSGPYLDGQDAGYRDMLSVARAWVRLAPERLVWGSDWPHVTESGKPDTGALLNVLAQWVADETLRKRILVDNPALLYDFPALPETP